MRSPRLPGWDSRSDSRAVESLGIGIVDFFWCVSKSCCRPPALHRTRRRAARAGGCVGGWVMGGGNIKIEKKKGIWFSGIMLASGARGPEFDSRNPPSLMGMRNLRVRLLLAKSSHETFW